MIFETKEVSYLKLAFLCLVFIEFFTSGEASRKLDKKYKAILLKIDSRPNKNLGFLSPESGELRGKGNMSVIYDFYADHNYSVRFNVTLIFHEYYYKFKIFFCDTSRDLKMKDALEKISFKAMDRETGVYHDSCRVVDPVEYPIYSFTGPGFMEVYKNESDNFIPERFRLLSQEVFNHTLFNFTYELILNDSKKLLAERQIPLDFFRPVTSLTEGHGCSLNGIPVLRLVNRLYKFKCKCLQGTYGNRCEWGLMCPKRKARQMCFNHGHCRATIGTEEGRVCVCDEGFDGDDCRFPILEKEKDFQEFHFAYNGTWMSRPIKELLEQKIKSLFPCDHKMQIANFENEFHVNESSQVVKISNQSRSLYDELSNLTGKCLLPTKCSNGKRKNNTTTLEWNNVSLRSSTLIKGFFKDSDIRICCAICSSTNSEVSFFKDEIPINLTPIQPMTSNNTWKEGQLEIISYRHEPPEVHVCLMIPNFSVNDRGKYRCHVVDGNIQQSKYYNFLKNQVPSLEVEPKAIAALKDSDVEVNCYWQDLYVNDTIIKRSIKPKWKVSPRVNYGSFSYFPSGTTGSHLLVHNITGELTVTCTIDNYSEIGSEFRESHITIIEPEDPICESEVAYQIKWPKVQVYKNFTARCPLGYLGHCVRECSSVNELQKSTIWNLPDCSKCERKSIFSILANVTSYQKGILKYLTNPNNLFKELRDEFTNGNNSVIIPGEIGTLVRQAIIFLEVPELVPDINVFYEWINIMISSNSAIHEKDLHSLQTLMRTYLSVLTSDICYLKISTHKHVAFYQQTPRVQNEIFNDSLTLNRSKESETNKGLKYNQTKAIRNSFTIMNFQFKEKINSMKRSVTIFQNPELILPYRKRIFGKGSSDHTNYLEENEFGEVNSPLVQINVYNDGKLESEINSSNSLRLTFYPCQLQSASNYATQHCGQFDPTSLTWNLAKCSFSASNNFCSCSCSDVIDGWIGLVAIPNQYNSKEFAPMPNAATTWGCGISLLFLIFTAISFLIQCAQSSLRVFSRFLETLALMIVNAVFLYCSLYETNEVAHMTVLMIISISLVLVIGLSASHQVDIHQKCTIAVASPSKSLNPPSSIMLLVSTFVAVVLGGMIWIIGKVQKIKLSNAWLPETDDSYLSFTVLSFIFFLLFLQLALAGYNCYKVKYVFHNPNWNTESLSSELNKRCVIGFLEAIYIISSWYQNAAVGMYIFLLISVTLGVAFFVFSICTCSSHSGSSASRSTISKASPNKNKMLETVNRFTLKWFRIPYSGVAETEVSNIHNDDSMEMEKNTTRGDGDSSFDASTINGYADESPSDRPNCITTQVDIEFGCRVVPCSPLHSVREEIIPQSAVDNFYTQSAKVSHLLNNNTNPHLSVEKETTTDRYVKMERTKTNTAISPKKICVMNPKVPSNGTNNNNQYVNIQKAKKEKDVPSRMRSNGNSSISRIENGKMYIHMNGKGNTKTNNLFTAPPPLDSLPKAVKHFPANTKVESTSKSQNASPLVTRIAGKSRTKSVDALTSLMSPDERKKRLPSQFASLRQLISKTKSSSRHFDSGSFICSQNNLEENGLIMAEDQSDCILSEDSKLEFFSNCQKGHKEHKRTISP